MWKADPGAGQGAHGHDVQTRRLGFVTVTEPRRRHVSVRTEKPAGVTAIRPFHVDTANEVLDDLRRRIAATKWPEKETVPDDSQGVPLATMQELKRYWGTEYDWRKCEAKLNALPQFITEIDGTRHSLHSRPFAT
jgi:hypothetical protein